MAGPRTANTARSTFRFVVMAGLSVAAVGAALIAQYRFDMQPCAWCILQRFIFLLIAAVCVIGALVRVNGVRIATGLLALALSVAGVAAAIYQHEVASKLYSCNLTAADKILSALKLETLWPSVMAVTATCADAAVSILGVPFEYWSLAMFALLGLLALAVIVRR